MYRSLLRTAYNVAAEQSQDDRTQVGGLVLNAENVVIATAANRFPRGVPFRSADKCTYILHAEELCVLQTYADGATLVAPWAACSRCARLIIDSTIVKVVRHKAAMDRTPLRWKRDVLLGEQMIQSSGIEIVDYDGEIGNCVGLMDGIAWTP